MTTDGAQVRPEQARGATTADLIDRLSQFQGPPGEFLVNLLALQCRLASASAGAILRSGADGRAEVVAMFPPPLEKTTAPVWLAQTVEAAGRIIADGITAIRPVHGPDDLYGQAAGRHVVLIPLRGGQGVRGLAAFVVDSAETAVLTASRERLELTVSLLSLYEMRLTLQHRQGDLARLRTATEVLAAVNEQDRFDGAAMAMCNEIASRWQCQRVSLGFLKGRYVKIEALSHTEKFSRKMKLVQDVEAAMEECLDQDIEIVHPPAPGATFVSRSAAELSKRHGPAAVMSFPLRKASEPIAVLTIERAPESPLGLDEAESLRLACDLCTARLSNLHEHGRWFGAKAAASARKTLSLLLGPRHTWIKVAAMCVFAAIVFLTFARGDYKVDAPFIVEATLKHVVPAPFDGMIEAVMVEPGDKVIAGRTVLASLDTSELRGLLAKARYERISYQKQSVAAERDGKTAESQIASAQADKFAQEVSLLEDRIEKARITASISGLVVVGDLKRHIRASVKTGQTLFEVAPLDSLRAEIFVPEDRIADVRLNQDGELAAVSYPDRRVPFIVERINPVAEVRNQRNVFKVRVRLARTRPWMRPGMEGVAKITIDRRLYVSIWTRGLVNWLRMKLWL